MDMKKICLNQVNEILKYKWVMGKKLGCDPGEPAISEWVKKFAKEYRKEYEEFLEVYIKEVVSEINDVDEKVARKVIESFIDKWCIDMCRGERKHLDEL